MRVRLKDIAEDLNLSKMTISKVLRGQADISDATKARVLKRVKELKYIPNISASSLRTGQTKTMALILPSISSQSLADVAGGIQETVSSAGYSLIVCSSKDDVDSEQRQIKVCLSMQVDALFIVSVQESAAYFEQIQSSTRLPVIFVGQRPAGAGEWYVSAHDEEIGRIACDHLIRRGCKRIAYFRGARTAVGDMRSSGYRQSLSEHGHTVQPDLVVDSMNPEESEYKRGHDAMMRLLDRRGRPDGVMTYTDMMALGAMDAASDQGIKIPEEMRFVGCGNDALLCSMRIPLTSIAIGETEMGQKAGRLALRAIAGGNKSSTHRVLIKPKLVRRKSSET